mgnify:CR=1 FL=1
MDRNALENEMKMLGFKLNYFNVDKLLLQLEQLNHKIKTVNNLPDIKKHEPVFSVKQSREYHVK